MVATLPFGGRDSGPNPGPAAILRQGYGIACITHIFYNSIQEHSAVYCGDELNADMSSSFGGIPRSLERGGCH